MGRSEGRARRAPVPVPGHRRDRAGPWRHQVERDSRAAERGNAVQGRRGAHGNGLIHGRRVGQAGFAAVAGGADENSATRSRVTQHVPDEQRAFRPSPAHIEDVGAVFHRIEYGGGQVVFFQKCKIGLQRHAGAQAHQRGVGGNAGNAQAIVCHRRGDARYAGAVAGLVHGIVVGRKVVTLRRKRRGVGEVPAAYIVHVPVVVVVNARPAGCFDRVDPDIFRQVFVGIVHAGIDDGDNDALFGRRKAVQQDLPSDLFQAVLIAQAGIVGHIVV